MVILDGRRGEPFDAVTWPLALSREGDVVAYAARRGREQFCVSGTRRYGPYAAVDPPVLSADGSVTAFAASDGAESFVVVNGEPGPRYAWAGHLAIHPDGRRLAYAAQRRGPTGAFRSFIVHDGREGPAFDRVTSPAISADGAVVAYGGRRDGAWRLVRGREESPVDGEIASVFLSPSGGRAGYVVEEAGRTWVVGPDGRGPSFDWIGWPALTEEGRTVYLASRGGTKVLVAGGRVVEMGDAVLWDLTVSPDGRLAEFGARRGRRLTWTILSLESSDPDLLGD